MSKEKKQCPICKKMVDENGLLQEKIIKREKY